MDFFSHVIGYLNWEYQKQDSTMKLKNKKHESNMIQAFCYLNVELQ